MCNGRKISYVKDAVNLPKNIFYIIKLPPAHLQYVCNISQGLHRLEKYLNLEVFLEKFLKIKSALKSIGKSLKGLEKSLNSLIFC